MSSVIENALNITITGLPANTACILLISGKISIPSTANTLLTPVFVSVPSSIMNPTGGSYTNGEVYYNNVTSRLMVYINGSWVVTTPLH